MKRLVKSLTGCGGVQKGLLLMWFLSPPPQLDVAVTWPHVLASSRKSVKYTQETMEKAVEKVKLMLADLGGTEILTPLRKVFRKPPIPGHPLQVRIGRTLTKGVEGMKILKNTCPWMSVQDYGNTVCISGSYYMGGGTDLSKCCKWPKHTED